MSWDAVDDVLMTVNKNNISINLSILSKGMISTNTFIRRCENNLLQKFCKKIYV